MTRKSLIALLLLAVISPVATAKAPSRDDLIDHVEAIYLQTSIFSSDSPLLDLFLQGPKAANREVSPETWSLVRKETATALNAAMTARGGALESILRKSLADLADKDLVRLATILKDPVYSKFQAALASPAVQKQMLQALMGDTVRINAAINGVLSSHGLAEIH
jgi:hypothetical protein